MLAEISSDAVATERGSLRGRTWYHSDAGDLYVWSARGGVSSFQLSFMAHGLEERREWWVEWNGKSAKAGFVDSKEVGTRTHDLKSPTVDMSTARLREAGRLARRFLADEGAGLPAKLRAFLDGKLAAL